MTPKTPEAKTAKAPTAIISSTKENPFLFLINIINLYNKLNLMVL